jgi:hypothetical protein
MLNNIKFINLCFNIYHTNDDKYLYDYINENNLNNSYKIKFILLKNIKTFLNKNI